VFADLKQAASAHRLADQPPRHRVGIAVDLDRTIGLHAPNQLARSLEWRHVY
jgi:hypothetical protein